MRDAPSVTLDVTQQQILEPQPRSRFLPARQVERARIVLRAADGWQDKDIAADLRVTAQKAARWRKRFLDRPKMVSAAKIQTDRR